MHRQWASVEESASRLLTMISQGCSEAELVQALDAMTNDRLLEVVTHIAHDGNTVLHAAAVRERLLSLAAILRNKVDVNTRNGGGYSPLYQCLCHNSLAAAQLLINHGADVNETVYRITGETLLHRMVKGDRTKAVELLISSGASTEVTTKDGDTPLHYASRYNRPALAQTMLRTECDVNAVNRDNQTALHIAIGNRYFDLAKLLVKNKCNLTIKDSHGMTALHAAVTASAIDLVRLMLTNNSTQINSKEKLLGRTPLLLACSNSTQKMASLLLSHGADANLTTNYRRSVLHVAAGTGNNGALGAVIKFTSNINALAINNKTALHFAVTEQHRDVVRALLKAGINVNLKDIDGNSALHMAASNGDNTILTTLLQHGAQLDATNMQQQTPLHVAFLEGNEDTGWILIDAGCDVEILDIHHKRAWDYLQAKPKEPPTPEHTPRDPGDTSIPVSARSVRFGDEGDEDAQKKTPSGVYLRVGDGAVQGGHQDDKDDEVSPQSATKNALSEFLHCSTSQVRHGSARGSMDSTTDIVAAEGGEKGRMDLSSEIPLDFSTLRVGEDIVSSTPLGNYTTNQLKHVSLAHPLEQEEDNENAHQSPKEETVPPDICVESPLPEEPDAKEDERSDDGAEPTARPTTGKHRQRKSSKGSKPARKTSKSKASKSKGEDHHGHRGSHGNHEHGHSGHAHGGDTDHQCGQSSQRKRKVGLVVLK